jgi:hypothetical protein
VEIFATRAQDMGLNIDKAYKGMYSYRDRFSEVVYRQLITDTSPGNPVEKEDPTDNLILPYLAVYVKGLEEEETYEYTGHVSNLYKFVGNQNITEPILHSITSTGNPVMKETVLFSQNKAQFRDEMIISSGVKSAIVGDIMPVMIISNSYNGTKAATVSFGLATLQNVSYVTFAFNLGQIRMVHIESAETSMTSAVSEYVETFRQNITSLISESMSERLTEEQMFATLDLIEGLGKRRREIISGDLPQSVTAWGMFMAIVRYSSLEENLNVKSMLENIAQSVLVIPARMYDVLERLQSQ